MQTSLIILVSQQSNKKSYDRWYCIIHKTVNDTTYQQLDRYGNGISYSVLGDTLIFLVPFFCTVEIYGRIIKQCIFFHSDKKSIKSTVHTRGHVFNPFTTKKFFLSDSIENLTKDSLKYSKILLFQTKNFMLHC